jgi:DNA-binding IclR family transcriptional regulator
VSSQRVGPRTTVRLRWLPSSDPHSSIRETAVARAQVLLANAGNGDETAGSQSITAVERALDVLLLFGRTLSPSLGVTEIAAELDIPKAAVHRILTGLRTRDLIAFDPASRRYLLGPAVVGLGTAYLTKLDVRSLAAQEMAWLSMQTGETATLSIRNGDVRLYVAQVLADREIRREVTIGSSHPLHAGASSKAFLAFDEDPAAYVRRHELERLADNTITDVSKLMHDLSMVRKRGYASSTGERQVGAASVAAPVFDHSGRVAAVVSVSGPAERMQRRPAAYPRALVASAGRLSARMGYAAGA